LLEIDPLRSLLYSRWFHIPCGRHGYSSADGQLQDQKRALPTKVRQEGHA